MNRFLGCLFGGGARCGMSVGAAHIEEVGATASRAGRLQQRAFCRLNLDVVAHIDRHRLEILEARLGATLPARFVATLVSREPVSEGRVAFVTPSRVWRVRTTYSLSNADATAAEQLDALYDLLSDVLPPHTLPFAADWAADFYLLALWAPHAGEIVYWHHAPGSGGHRVEPVAPSIDIFYSGFRPFEGQDDA